MTRSGSGGNAVRWIIPLLGLALLVKRLTRSSAFVHSPLATAKKGRTRKGNIKAVGKDAGAHGGQAVGGILHLRMPPLSAGGFEQALRNDACMLHALQAVTAKLLVVLKGAEDQPSGRVREYVAELYSRLWDAACVVERELVDVQVLLPEEGGGEDMADWSVALMQHDVQLLLTDEPPADGQQLLHFANARRSEAGLADLALTSLWSVSQEAWSNNYVYLEDPHPGAVLPRFERVACGGTFDHMHNGHKKLLTLAASICTDTLTVGVTNDAMLSKKSLKELISPVDERIALVTSFLEVMKPSLNLRVEEIQDPLGPPVQEAGFQAIVVSSETTKGAEKINSIRLEKGMAPLQIVVTRRTEAASLSSSYIRACVARDRRRAAEKAEKGE